ncbi:hypothetical protein D3C75_504890 [compost metagenome]
MERKQVDGDTTHSGTAIRLGVLTEHVDGVHSPDIVRIISTAIKEAPLSRPPWWKDPAQAANEPAVDGEALVIDEALIVDD